MLVFHAYIYHRFNSPTRLAGLIWMLRLSKWPSYSHGMNDHKKKYLLKICAWLPSCRMLSFVEHYGYDDNYFLVFYQ